MHTQFDGALNFDGADAGAVEILDEFLFRAGVARPLLAILTQNSKIKVPSSVGSIPYAVHKPSKNCSKQ